MPGHKSRLPLDITLHRFSPLSGKQIVKCVADHRYSCGFKKEDSCEKCRSAFCRMHCLGAVALGLAA